MNQNLEKSIDWCKIEGIPADSVRACWHDLRLAEYPSGLDYYGLDCSLLYGVPVFTNWLSSALWANPLFGTGSSMVGGIRRWWQPVELAELIHSIDSRRRRRVRMERDWSSNTSRHMNRLLRVKKRALSLVEETEDEKVVVPVLEFAACSDC